MTGMRTFGVPWGWLVAICVCGASSLRAESPAPRPVKGIWISREELARLPTVGLAWDRLRKAADRPLQEPNLKNQDDTNNVGVLAKALVYGRTGIKSYRAEVMENCQKAIGTERGGRSLALGRNLAAYVIAADLVELDPADDKRFREWLREALTEQLEGRSLQETHEARPNNWGTHAGASRAAIAVYLNDREELERTAQVFKGYLGDRTSHASFKFGELSWQADPDAPVGINPQGAMRDGRSIDGVLPDDMRRGGVYQWPPVKTGYPWEALQGAVVQAEILHRAGYDTWNWQDRALLRAIEFLHQQEWFATGDDHWVPWVINFRYGTDFPAKLPAGAGKTMGWTDWTHARLSQRKEAN